jgi:hypothetical protein
LRFIAWIAWLIAALITTTTTAAAIAAVLIAFAILAFPRFGPRFRSFDWLGAAEQTLEPAEKATATG